MAGPLTASMLSSGPGEPWSPAREVAVIDALPARHHRRIGLYMLQIGMGLLLPCLCLGLATMHAAFALALGGGLLARFPLWRMPGFALALAFAGWQLLSLAPAWMEAPTKLPKGLGPAYVWLSLFLAQAAFVAPALRRWSLQLLLLTTACSALLATAQFTVGLGGTSMWKVDSAGERYHLSVGFAPIHLTQGFLMAMVSLVLIDARIIAGGLEPVQLWFCRGYALVAMVISGARLALVALPFGLAVRSALAGGRRARLLAPAILISALVAGGGALLLLSPASLGRMLHGEDGRLAIWRVAATEVLEHPWLGLGGSNAFHDSYNAAFARVLPQQDNEFAHQGGAPHAHNSLLSLAVDFGVPAAALYLAFLGRALLPGWRARRGHPRAWALALALTVTSLVAGMFEDLSGHSASSYATYVLIGLALALCQGERQGERPGGAA